MDVYGEVAPPAGAWIETAADHAERPVGSMSPLPQGRGSKPAGEGVLGESGMRSPLPQGRGSKPAVVRPLIRAVGRPSRRGVDRNDLNPGSDTSPSGVAPPAGAWIETS